MAQSPSRFAQLLQEGINAVAERTGKPKGVVRDELGYAIGRKGGSAIEYWAYGDGHLPRQPSEVEGLARALMASAGLDCTWLTAFLESAGYSDSKALVGELFPALAQRADNLPLAVTPFVGRVEELADLAAMIANPDCRLITLVGPGGSGKTRLATEVARNTRLTFADGATFVALAPLASAELIASTVATALNLSLGGNTPAQTQLLHYLRRQARLLVLDNFEHLLAPHEQSEDESAALGLIRGILAQAPKVTLLVTSRERLNVQGEWVYEVAGLVAPDGNAMLPALAYSAPAFFVQTAQRTQASFTPTAADEAAILHICRLVEGMPLALELAAAWVRVLSCSEIADEIAASLDFLTTTQRNLPARHRSMRAVLDHSWQLLSKTEQQVLARCSVLRGGFTRVAAEQVAGATLQVLAALVDKSLLSHNDEGRYEIHELARQYGVERLTERNEEVSTRNRHLTFFMQLSETAEPRLRSGPQIVEWHNQIEREYENLRAALDWALTDGNFEQGLRIVGALWPFWMNRGYASEGQSQTERFLSRPEAVTLPYAHARALNTGATLAYYQNLFPVAEAWLSEGFAVCRALGPSGKPILALMLMTQAYLAIILHDLETIEAASREILLLGEELEDAWLHGHGLLQLATVMSERGDVQQALETFQQSVAAFRADGESVMRGIALKYVGISYFELGEYAAAYRYLEQGLAIFEELADKGRSSNLLRLMSNLALTQGNSAEAEELLTQALRYGQEIAYTPALIESLDALGRLAQRQADSVRAYDYHRQCLMLSIETENSRYIAYSLEALAALAARQGQAERAARLLGAGEAQHPSPLAYTAMFSPTRDPLMSAEHERLIALVQSELGQAACDAAWAAGSAMTLEQAVAYALESEPF